VGLLQLRPPVLGRPISRGLVRALLLSRASGLGLPLSPVAARLRWVWLALALVVLP
jgi:hypothetical protein